MEAWQNRWVQLSTGRCTTLLILPTTEKLNKAAGRRGKLVQHTTADGVWLFCAYLKKYGRSRTRLVPTKMLSWSMIIDVSKTPNGNRKHRTRQSGAKVRDHYTRKYGGKNSQKSSIMDAKNNFNWNHFLYHVDHVGDVILKECLTAVQGWIIRHQKGWCFLVSKNTPNPNEIKVSQHIQCSR